MTRELGQNTMHKDTKKGLLKHLTKKVRPRNLKEGDVVLKVFRDETFDPRGKMKPKWFGPFIIKKIMPKVATRNIDLDGKEMLHLINMDRLRRYNIRKKKEKKSARLKT